MWRSFGHGAWTQKSRLRNTMEAKAKRKAKLAFVEAEIWALPLPTRALHMSGAIGSGRYS